MDGLHREFEWHPGKAASNVRRHDVSFNLAATVFNDPLAASMPDDEHSDHEERWVTIGQAENGWTLVVVHTFRQAAEQAVVRIISARRATSAERKAFESQP